MKRLASTQLYIEITSKIISDIRNIIFSGNSLYKVIDRKIDWLRSRKTTQQFFSLIKEMLDDHTRLQYKKINEYLLKKFEYKKDTFYVVNQFNTKFNSIKMDRIEGIFGDYKQLFDMLWSDNYIKNIINNHYFFIQNYKDLTHAFLLNLSYDMKN